MLEEHSEGFLVLCKHQASQRCKATSSHKSAEHSFSPSRECLYKLSSLPESSQQQLHIDESAGSRQQVS